MLTDREEFVWGSLHSLLHVVSVFLNDGKMPNVDSATPSFNKLSASLSMNIVGL